MNSYAEPLHPKEYHHKLTKLKLPQKKPKSSIQKNVLQRYPGSVNPYRNYFPRLVEKLNPFHKILKADVPINIKSELKEAFDSVTKELSDASELALKQPLPEKHLNMMTNANFRRSGYTLIIEDNPNQKIQSTRKTYTRVVFGSKSFSRTQLKKSIYSKDFSAIYMVFLKFPQFLREASKPTFVITDNKSTTRFFQTKAVPPSWIESDNV